MQPSQSGEGEGQKPLVAPAPVAAPAKMPMKIPMKMPVPGLAVKAPMPALSGVKRPDAPVAAAAPLAKKVRRSPSPSSSSSSGSSSDSDSDSSSGSSSDSDSGSSSSSGSYSSSRSSVSLPRNTEPTLFDIAKSSGLIDTSVLEKEEEEEVVPEGPPPRPPVIRSFPSDIDKALERYNERLNREESTIQIKDDNKSVSLGTSKINYIDPRIICSWATAQKVPINKLFSATIMKKFPWAMDAEDYDF